MGGTSQGGDPNAGFDRTIFENDILAVGIFRLPRDHPGFRDAGEIHRPLFVFPRTSVVLEYEGRRAFVADPATVTYYNPGQPYKRTPDDPRGDYSDWFSIRQDVALDILEKSAGGEVGEGALFHFSHGPNDAETFLLQRQLLRYILSSDRPDRRLVEETAVEIFSRVVSAAVGRSAEVQGQNGLAEQIKGMVRRSFCRSMSLREMAGDVGVSVSHMCRVFRASTGTTIHRYRHDLRLRRSLELVASQDSDLSEIAFRLGFSSHSHFTSRFQQTFGTTPSAFRDRRSSRRLQNLVELGNG